MSTAPSAMNFCPQCGARLVADARFCAGCGRAVEARAAQTPAATRLESPAAVVSGERRGWRDQLPGLVVLGVFLAVGLGLWVTILRPGAPTSSAPTRQGPPETAGMPPGHPPTTLPEEAKKFVASLVDKAQAAPNDVAAWKQLAQVQARAAEIDASYGAAAIASYQHVLGLAADDGDAIRGLANVYYDQQQYAAAAEQYERYLRAHPGDPGVQTDLATTYLYQRQFDRAVDLYKSVLKAHPDFLQAHFNLGLAYEATGRHEDALASLATARGLASDDATRGQIDRVVAQLKGERPGTLADVGGAPGGAGHGQGAPATTGGPGMAAGAGGGGPAATAGGTAAASAAAMAKATDFKSAVEAGLRAHSILGPKITAIDWPTPTSARVTVAGFPMQSMPEFARNLFKARLETILDDAKTRFPTNAESAIELVDAAGGTSMERVTH